MESTKQTLQQVINLLSDRGIHHAFDFDKNGIGLFNTHNGKVYSMFELQLLKTYTWQQQETSAKGGFVYILGTYDGSIGFLIDGDTKTVGNTTDQGILNRMLRRFSEELRGHAA